MKYNSVKDPIRVYTEVLGGKWRLLILNQLFSNTERFKDLLKSIEGITPRMLTKELRMLEKYNLVEKEVYKEVPPRVEYSLTDEGVKLYPLIENIQSVGTHLAHLVSEEVSIEHSVIVEKEVIEEKIEFTVLEETKDLLEVNENIGSMEINPNNVLSETEELNAESIVSKEEPKKIIPPKEPSVIQLELF